MADFGLKRSTTDLPGGGSDGNFTAALRVPTFDGLGADRETATAHHEQTY